MLGLKLNHVSKRGHWMQFNYLDMPLILASGINLRSINAVEVLGKLEMPVKKRRTLNMMTSVENGAIVADVANIVWKRSNVLKRPNLEIESFEIQMTFIEWTHMKHMKP